MADVVVSSEIVLQRDQFLAELRAMQQEIEQFSQRMGAMRVEIPVKLDTTGATTQLEAFVRSAQAQGINIPLNVGAGGGGPLGSPATPNFTMPGAGGGGGAVAQEAGSFFQQVNVTISQSLRQVFQQFNEQVEEAAAEAATASSPAAGGGGRGGGGFAAPSGFGRYLTYGFAAREAFRAVMASRQYGVEQYEAGNDQAAQAEATLKYSHQRFPLADLFEDPTGMKEAEIRGTLAESKFDSAYGNERQSRAEEAQTATARAGLTRISGAERARGQAEETYRESLQAIDNKQREETAKVTNEASTQRARAEAKFDGAGEYVSNQTVDSILAGSDAATAARTAAAKERDTTVAQAEAVARNRVAEIERTSAAQRDALEQERQNRLRDITADEILQNTQSTARITNTGVERAAAQAELQGQPISAQKMQFAAQQKAEIDALQAKIDNERTKGNYGEVDRLAGEMNAKIAANPDLIAAHNQQLDVQENLRNISSQKQVDDTKASAQEDLQRAGGNIGGTAMDRLKREDSERVDILNKQADQLDKTNKAEADRLRTLAEAEKEAGTSREAALRKSQELRSSDAADEIFDKAQAMKLRASGQSYRAGEESANDSYNRRIAELRRDPTRGMEADALVLQRDAAAGERQTYRQEDVQRIRAGTRELSFRNEHRDAEADLQRLNEQHREELFNAGGDPHKIEALNAEFQERLKGFLRNKVTGTSVTTDATQSYFAAQAAVLGDPTGSQARSLTNARAQAQRELNANMNNAGAAAIGQGAAAAGGGAGGNAARPGAAATVANAGDAHTQSSDKLIRAAEKLDEVADKLNQAVAV